VINITILIIVTASEVDDDNMTTSHTTKNTTPSQIHTTAVSHSYTSDFEDNTVPTTNMGYSADFTDKKNKNSEVTEDISSEGDTLVELQQQQLDDTLQNGKANYCVTYL